MSEKIDLSIIIVNFRSRCFLDACLVSVREKICSPINAEIIIVNNDPDENVESAKANFPEMAVINNKKNAGYGQACNLGVRYAQGEILLFLNPDTEILSDNVGEVMDLLKNKKNAIVGSGLLMEDGNNQRWCAGRKVDIWNLIKNNLGISADKGISMSTTAIKVGWVAGTAMFFRKDIFQKIGGFDEEIFMYFEDVDLCRRVKKAGYKIIYHPLFRILHHGGKSYLKKSEQKKHYYASQEYYFKKHCGSFQAALVKILRRLFTW